ncbi:hypothetical protein [Kytococcus sedentarius]|uniref:hypothetical protein n=1 Tax=Kytococcus sedentarius TaxID=1276 RepID=UPI00194E7FD9|nr:hypothetical protein [Kytococcus sedentarius]QRO86720.1 hypothetical protein I6J30_07525 [Kytococcus sedentarius]
MRQLGRDAVYFVPLAVIGGVILHIILVPLFGTEFAAAETLVLPLTAAGIILSLYRQVTGWILAAASEKTYMATEGVVAALSLVAYPGSVLLGGSLGAAWGTCLVYASGMLIAMAVYSAVARKEGR